MRIRIMHVVDTLGKGGLENGLVNLIQRMSSAEFEHTVYVMRQFGENVDRLPAGRVRLMCLGKKDTDFPIQVAALARGIREARPHVVHSRNWSAIEAVLAGRWVRSCALIHSEHGLEAHSDTKQPWRRSCLRRLAYELADQVLSVSYQLRDVHARATGFPARRIEVIHNGVDSRRFYPDAAARAQVRDGLGIGDNEFCIGAVANLLPVKDHMTLLRAVSGLAAVCSNWRLLIAGEGPQRGDLEGFVNSHATWKHRVSFLGSSDCVPDILRALDVYVLPSVAEGISNSLLEAMATGVPPIVSAVGGNPEVVVDGESGLLFPAGDPAQLTERLQSLRAHEELRRRLGKNAMNRAREEFSIESMIRKYEQLYRNVVPALTDRVPAISGI